MQSDNQLSFNYGFFGKLPKFADFIKYNASGAEINSIDIWLQEGIAAAKIKYKNDWDMHYEKASAIKFVYPFTGTDNLIIGILWSSRDKSKRNFPFIMFSVCKKDLLASTPLQLWMLRLGGVYSSFTSLFNNFADETDINNIKSMFNNHSHLIQNHHDAEKSYSDYLTNNSVQYLFGLDSSGLENYSLNDLINDKLSYLPNSGGLSFNIESADGSEFQSAGFITDILLNIFPGFNSIPAIFWTEIQNRVALHIFFQKPSSLSFGDMIVYQVKADSYDKNSENIFNDSSIINPGKPCGELITAIKNNLR